MLQERPRCECHDEPMRWHKRARYPKGGFWVCLVRERESQRKWREANREKKLKSDQRYRDLNKDKRREYDAEYHATGNRGWVRKRKRVLSRQRDSILEQLTNLRKDLT